MTEEKVIVLVTLKSGFSRHKGKIFANSSIGLIQDIEPNTVVVLTHEQYEKLKRLYGDTHNFTRLDRPKMLNRNRQTREKRKRRKKR